MKNLIYIIIILMISATIFISSCEKANDPVPPAISFKQATGYISANTPAKYADTLKFGVTAASNGTDALVKFHVTVNGQNVFDSTFNSPTFVLNLYSVKTILDKEVWKFVATDIAGNSKTDSIVITGNFGPITTFANVKLGAQSNTTEKGFIDFCNCTSPTLYTQADAFLHQADIDMFCFYENTVGHVNLMTMAAPGSGITGIFTGSTSPELYTIKNITFFVKTTLTAAQFDAVQNDAVILASYDAKNQFKKAKLLTVGDVYAFKLTSGKYGLYKVTAVDGTETGTLQIAVKIQN